MSKTSWWFWQFGWAWTRERRLPAHVLLGAMAIGAAGCGSMLSLNSAPVDQEIQVDGQIDEWAGRMTRLKDSDDDTSIGVMNDAEAVYLSLVTRDRDLIGQIMRRGLQVWFDREGGKRKSFGIHFPLGLGMPGAGPTRRGRPGGGREGVPARDSEAMAERMEAMQTELEILGEDGDHARLPVEAAPGVEVKLAMSFGELAYEMRVPLRLGATSPYAIEARPGEVIGVAVVTPRMERGFGPDGDRPGGMGRGGMRGGMRGEMQGGAPGGPARGGSRPLDRWLQVTLANPAGEPPSMR